MMAPMAALLIAPTASSFIKPMASSLVNAITRNRQEGEFLPLLALRLMVKVLEKESEEQQKDIIVWIKIFNSAISRLLSISITSPGLMVCFQETIYLE